MPTIGGRVLVPLARRARRLVAAVVALAAATGLLGAVPAQAATLAPVTVTITQVGDWYESTGSPDNKFQVKVADAAGKPVTTGVLMVKINGWPQGPTSAPAGEVRAAVSGTPVHAGENTVFAYYWDDNNVYADTQATVAAVAFPATIASTIQASVPASVVAGDTVSISADVSAAGVAPTGIVMVTIDDIHTGSAPVVDGHADIRATIPNIPRVGTYRVSVAYGGGLGVLPAASPTTTLTVTPAQLTVAKQPTVSGPVVVGATLSAPADGYWTVAVDTTSFQWLANGVAIKGATASSYLVPASMAGKRLSVRVVGRMAAHTDSTLQSAQTAAVRTAGSQLTARAHVQGIGWQPWSSGDVRIGTTGRALRVEALQAKLVNPAYSGSLTTTAYVQNIGWMKPVADGATAGTTGRGLRVEAVRLKLTGAMATHYDIWYRAYLQYNGWLAWTSNGADAGSVARGRRVEALEIRLVPKGQAGPAQAGLSVAYLSDDPDASGYLVFQAHVQNIGWQQPIAGGQGIIGTTGLGLRMEAIRVRSVDADYRFPTAQAHVQNIGWMAPVSNGGVVGTQGRGLRIEAIRLSLKGTPFDGSYNIYYRTHVQNFGWTGWAKNGASSGSAGYGYRMEAMEVRVINKYDPPPAGNGAPAFFQRG